MSRWSFAPAATDVAVVDTAAVDATGPVTVPNRMIAAVAMTPTAAMPGAPIRTRRPSAPQSARRRGRSIR